MGIKEKTEGRSKPLQLDFRDWGTRENEVSVGDEGSDRFTVEFSRKWFKQVPAALTQGA